MKAVKPLISARKALTRKLERICYFGRKIHNQSDGNRLIADMIRQNKPLAMGKIGNVELCAISNYLKHKRRQANSVDWDRLSLIMHRNAGIFPAEREIFNRFSEELFSTLKKIDLFAVWFNRGEAGVIRRYSPQAHLTRLRALEPYYYDAPWSGLLLDRELLVVHPFAETIQSQYARRTQIWPDRPDVLPELKMDTIQVPLSDALVKSPYQDWFEALESLKRQMEGKPFDTAIIGAGAWSLPLAAHAKDMGRIGIHLGGATQILFGISGLRWDSHPIISKFYNPAWRRPSESETPGRFREVEDGCYW